jgi:predicted alpha-1,2-mannosidase
MNNKYPGDKMSYNTIFKKSFLMLFSGVLVTTATVNAQEKLTKYVDPLIGTGFHGHVFVGANVPFGAVQLGPSNLSEGWDWSSGYHISDSTIVGFQHTHLSGTGIGDLGDISFMPTTGPLKVTKGNLKDMQSGYVSLFSHQEETVRPGYYAVNLKRYQIGVKLTASERVGMHEYTFPKSEQAHIIIDLKEGIGWDRPTETSIKKLNDSTVVGYRHSSGWAKDQRIYFTAVFSRPIKDFVVYDSLALKTGVTLTGKKVKGILHFKTNAGEKVMVKVGISPISVENAMMNIKAEIPGWNFNQVAAAADEAWNKELQKVNIKTNDAKKKTVFYTALYHALIAPSIYNDHNGDYLGTDKEVYKNPGFTNLTTFSLWDTYRALNPLYTLIQPEKVNDIINSMLAVYKQQGKLPVWHLMGNETNTMPGYSAVPVVADAYLKGFKGFDANLAFEAVKTTAMQDERGLKHVKELGYIPADSRVESVAMGLEYSLADWGIAKMAKRLNKEGDATYFTKRAGYYKNYFDASTKFMRGRLGEKEWRTPFSPFVARHEKDDYSEGNSWQYSWLVPHDVKGLIALQGGEKPFIKKLDSLFVAEGDMGDEASNDISGLIGQYAHGNEPSHHITYLYAFAGQPWKTAEKVRFIMNNFYTDKPDGIIGNEDVGQMSSWYILSSLGIYQVNPANGVYVFGSPLFDEATLKLGAGKSLRIKANNNSDKNLYIQGVTFNGKKHSRSYITYQELNQGGELVFEMGNKPSKTFGVAKANRP